MSRECRIDARGMLCPKPLMLVKKALEEAEVGTRFMILLDNDMACANVARFLQDSGAAPVTTQEGREMTISAEKKQVVPSVLPAGTSCSTGGGVAGPLVMVFTQNGMGHGAEELGKILIQACINTLADVKPRPDVLVFYNGSVQLTVEGSPVLDTLKNLSAAGVKILVCGTCLNYFQLKKQLRVGVVSNMFEILDQMAGAGKVIYP
jgi:selenium metabolism protein YedF